MAHTSALGSTPRGSFLSAVVAEIGAFFTALGAAVRVANAVESGRQPESRDLKLLGITGPLPRMR